MSRHEYGAAGLPTNTEPDGPAGPPKKLPWLRPQQSPPRGTCAVSGRKAHLERTYGT